MHYSLKELIQGCIKRNPQMMELLYKKYAPSLWVVCLRYARNQMIAEDIMHEGFIKTFQVIHQFKGRGSFEGWLKKIFLNTAINYCSKHHNKFEIQEVELDEANNVINNFFSDVEENICTDQLLKMLKNLPDGYRIVFNLYAIEGYSHKEIAKMLNCTESNSKSQLLRARKCLIKMLKKNNYPVMNFTINSKPNKQYINEQV